MSKSVTYILVVECTYDIARVCIQFAVQIYLTTYAHRVLQQVAVYALCPVRLIALNRQVQVERLCYTILVGEIDNLTIRTDVQVLTD